MKKDTKIQSKELKPYRSPSLFIYGAVSELTCGGSGNANEGNKGTADFKKRP